MSYELWQLVGRSASLVGARPDTDAVEKLRRTLPAGTVIGVARDGVVIRTNASKGELDLLRAAIAHAWREGGGAPPAPLPEPTSAPSGRELGMRFGRAQPTRDDADEEEVAPAPKPAPKPKRPVATLPPLARRRIASVAGGTLTSTPIATPAAPAPGCPASGCHRSSAPWRSSLDESLRPLCTSHRAIAHRVMRVHELDAAAAVARVLARAGREPVLARAPRVVDPPAPAVADEPTTPPHEPDPQVARLQRLLNTVSVERDALRARTEQLEADLTAARGALLEALAAEAWSNDVTELAMVTGLAMCEALRERLGEREREVVAEGDRATRAEAELEQRFRRAADDYQRGVAEGERRAAEHPAAPVPVVLDEVTLARVAARAARQAVRLDRGMARLVALADELGVDAVVRLVEGALALRRAVG